MTGDAARSYAFLEAKPAQFASPVPVGTRAFGCVLRRIWVQIFDTPRPLPLRLDRRLADRDPRSVCLGAVLGWAGCRLWQTPPAAIDTVRRGGTVSLSGDHKDK